MYRQLRRAILSGELAAGSRLREVEIANAMQVSRTPVREAVSRLIGDRLVRELPVGGVEVVDTSAELYEVYVIREALERCAGRLAAARIDENKLKKLEELAARMEAINYTDVEKREAVNSEFHMMLVEAAASPRLLNMIFGFREFFMSRGRSRYDRKRANQAVQDHRELITALRARDADQVERVLQRHLKLAYVDLIVQESKKNRSS
ncbi:MAG: GntR family transcriptional regulator [Xanthobacteraceae bacterium]